MPTKEPFCPQPGAWYSHEDHTCGCCHKFVLLRGLEEGNEFFSTNTDSDPTKSYDGEIIYEVIGYADSVEEAQTKLYGRAFPR